MTAIDKTAAALGANALQTAMALRRMKTQLEAQRAVESVVRDNVKAATRMVDPNGSPPPRRDRDTY